MNYKTIIKNRESRIKVLSYLKWVPSKWMLRLQYWIKMKRILRLKNPKRFTEKLQWYKLNYHDPLLHVCVDKYEVRKYIKEKGLADNLVDLYFVTDNPKEINFDKLPNEFVIKTTNGSGTNIICKDKSKLNINTVYEELDAWVNRDIFASGREWSYKNIVPKIIIEEYLEDAGDNFNGINDYKFLCFNGEPKYVIFDVDRHTDHKRNIYDINWNYIDISTDRNNFGDIIPKPEGYEEMVKTAKILSEDFPFVRVDLYYINQKVYFGELTFYPWSGYVQFNPDNFDFTLGRLFSLPTEIKN